MSQLTGYGPLAPPAGRYAPQPRGVASAPAPATRSSPPSLLALLAAIYLCSVPTLSSSSEELSWIPQAIGVGVGVGWLIFGLLFKGLPIVWAKPIVLFVAWALWCSTGLMVTLNGDYFRTNWFAILKVCGIAWVLSQCIRTRADLLACLTLVGLASLVVFISGADTIMKATSFTGTRETVGSRAEGILINNANELGIFGVVVLLSGMTGFWSYRSVLMKVIGIATIPIGLYLISASGSRMAMLGVLIAGAGTYFFHLRKVGAGGMERKIAMLVLGVIVAGGSIYYVSNNPFFFRLKAAFADKNAIEDQPRFQYFLRGMAATAQNPIFGLGIGGFMLHGLGGKGAKSHYSHSTLTETLSCTGVPGFLIYFGGQLALFNLIRKLRKAPLPKHDMAMVNMIMVTFWTVLLMSIVTVMFADRLIWPLYGTFCGYLVALKKRHLDAHPRVAGSYAR